MRPGGHHQQRLAVGLEDQRVGDGCHGDAQLCCGAGSSRRRLRELADLAEREQPLEDCADLADIRGDADIRDDADIRGDVLGDASRHLIAGLIPGFVSHDEQSNRSAGEAVWISS